MYQDRERHKDVEVPEETYQIKIQRPNLFCKNSKEIYSECRKILNIKSIILLNIIIIKVLNIIIIKLLILLLNY